MHLWNEAETNPNSDLNGFYGPHILIVEKRLFSNF
jgi:hypothetical protein